MALDMNTIKSKREELQRGGGYNADFDKLEKGNNVRRILPPKGDKKVFWAEGYLHFGLGEDGKTTVTCLDTFDDGEPCPVCAYIEELKKSRSKEDKKLADSIKKTKRTYIAVINRDSEEEKPVVLSVGKTILQPIIDLICDPDYGDITDFEDGTDITIKKSGTGINTEYTVTPKRNSSVACEDMTEEELQEALPDLDALFVRKSPEELQAILDGEEYEPDEDDETEDEEVDEDEGGYDDMSLDELIECCEDRGLKMPARVTKLKLINLLNDADEAEEEERAAKRAAKSSRKPSGGKGKKSDEDEEVPFNEDDDADEDDETDDTMDEIQAALNRRKNKGGRK